MVGSSRRRRVCALLRRAGLEVIEPHGIAAADDATAVRIARERGADAVVVGSVEARRLHVDVDVRLLRTASGAVDASAHAERESTLGGDACCALVAAP